jgi:hypothetical protein
MDSVTDTFESLLADARASLSSAREEYRAVEQSDSVPQTLITSLTEFERELNELDDRLEVTEDDVALARRSNQRVKMLAVVFASLRTRQRTIVETDVARLTQQLEFLHAVADSPTENTSTDALEKECSMLQKLVENDRQDRIEGSDRLSIPNIEMRLRTHRFTARYTVPDSASARALIQSADALLDDIHEFLGALGDENESRTAFASDLQSVKELRSDAEGALDDGDVEAASESAAVGFEGCLMLHYEIARAYANQRVTESLAEAIAGRQLALDVDVDACVASGDAERLLNAVGEALRGEVEESTVARLRRLLDEHDGSVSRTASATDFDVSEILGHVSDLYVDGAVGDVKVDFDS